MKKVYGYARISRDEDKKNYGSIETQKNLINEFANKNGWKVEKIFVDDDISGYIPIEDRPNFYELYQLVEKCKEKPIVLMKDWSRLSRNNGIAQSILTNWKKDEVELILIKEMGGVFNILTDDDDIVGITTWINERYVKDTSRKVRDALGDRLKKGVYISGPRYGYIKGENGSLTVNEEVKEAVQTIFNLYEEGCGITAIVNKLNKEYDYKNPSIVEAERFRKERGRAIKRNVREYWENDMISKILKDEIYTGTLITHKKEVKGIHGKAKVLPKEENYRFENHHEAIISKEQFERVQQIRNFRRIETSNYKKGKYNYIFGGFIKCGECGASGTGFTKKGKQYYECLNYSKYRNLRCVYNSIKEEYILESFKVLLSNLKIQYKYELENININDLESNSNNNIKNLKMKLYKIKKEYKKLHMQKVKELSMAKSNDEEILIEEIYVELIQQKSNEIQNLKETIKIKESLIKNIKVEKNAIDYFDDFLKLDKLPKQVLSLIIDKIVITKDKNLEFILKINIEELMKK